MCRLSKQVLSLWAKKENKNGQELWLPLIAHLIDTQKVINWLYYHWLNDCQRQILQQNMTTSEIERLVNFIGYFHDIGKATPAFQTKPSYSRDYELDEVLMEKMLRGGFTKLAEYEPALRRKSPHALAGETILENSGLNSFVGAIIGAHHGKPVEKFFDSQRQFNVYISNYLQSSSDKNLQSQWLKVYHELINYGLFRTGYSTLEAVPKITQSQAILLTGLLIMADWIASSEYLNEDFDQPMFPLIDLDQGFFDLDMERRFEQAILTWDISGHWTPQIISDVDQHYEKRWNFDPRPVQHKMSEVIGKITDPGIIIIEAPMGIGKTEIALTAAEQLALATGSSGLFMGLPTQATSNAMFSRVDKWVDELAKEENVNLPIRLMHGKAQFNHEMQNLPNAENIDSQNSVVVNSWFSGKKSMLADFSIGTIDHLLLMCLKQKHLFLRHLGLSGKIVIIDEIHSYDVYMSSYLKCALQWLGAYHIPVIALSATLPKEKRFELVKSYYCGKYGHQIKQEDDTWHNSQSYPLLTYLDGTKVKQVDKFPKSTNSQKVKVIRLDHDDQQLVNKIADSIKDGGVAGVIVNTIKRAQELSQLLPASLPQIVLHSAFLAPDRSRLEEQLQKYIGKRGQRPEKLVVIGTQVLEQSLDIDFDVLFTDIAPVDLILQRMGRLHRHAIYRPDGLTTPIVYLLGINSFGDYGDANEAIYEKYWLMKTDHFFPSTVNLPYDISPLVQAVYDPATDDEIANIQDARVEEKLAEEKAKNKAKVYQITSPKRKKNLWGWLDREQEVANTDDATAEAAVRDIKESLEVVMIKHTPSGNFLLDGRSLNEVTSKEIAQQLIRLPSIVTPDIEKAINELEKRTDQLYHNWQSDSWLKGMLALTLNEHLTSELLGWRLRYSSKLGLKYEKDEENE